ncbi:MAG: phosphoenolpyruvate synthase, partial [Candidatus Fermentibacteraceae bacterium]
DTIVLSEQVLGQGSIEGVTDIIYVPSQGFDRASSTKAAADVGRLNARLRREGRKSLLIGPGRWGSADPWLGIPVHWSQISTAACIVETHLPGLEVEPSQGTHFFQNVTSLGIGYFTMTTGDGHLDLEWLQAQQPLQTEGHARLIRTDAPLQIHIDRRSGRGAIQPPRTGSDVN